MYSVKEVFYTLQGEGANAGRPAVFCRFAGCNLWTGRERDRSKAICQFCDTEFVGTNGEGGGKFASPDKLAAHVSSFWPVDKSNKFVVCTGGEPLLQLDAALIASFHLYGFTVAVETNGTLDAPHGLDWICMSPKAGTSLRVTEGNELKLVFPQNGLDPSQCEGYKFEHFFLQPMDGDALQANTALTVDYCLQHPRWRLSLQTHKLLGLR